MARRILFALTVFLLGGCSTPEPEEPRQGPWLPAPAEPSDVVLNLRTPGFDSPARDISVSVQRELKPAPNPEFEPRNNLERVWGALASTYVEEVERVQTGEEGKARIACTRAARLYHVSLWTTPMTKLTFPAQPNESREITVTLPPAGRLIIEGLPAGAVRASVKLEMPADPASWPEPTELVEGVILSPEAATMARALGTRAAGAHLTLTDAKLLGEGRASCVLEPGHYDAQIWVYDQVNQIGTYRIEGVGIASGEEVVVEAKRAEETGD
jgi:hypothetical protein